MGGSAFCLHYVLKVPSSQCALRCADALPRLEWLLLTNNKLGSLGDLDALASLPHLRYVSLLDNPVTKQPGYRLYVIARCMQLKMLDFRKVKQQVGWLEVDGLLTGPGSMYYVSALGRASSEHLTCLHLALLTWKVCC